MNAQPPSQDALNARLRGVGEDRYNGKHPFQHLLHSGGGSLDKVRAWVINRYLYLARTPMKVSVFLSLGEDQRMCRIWRHRIEDHDGTTKGTGSIQRWLASAEVGGRDPEYVRACRGIRSAKRFAVDAYVDSGRMSPGVWEPGMGLA